MAENAQKKHKRQGSGGRVTVDMSAVTPTADSSRSSRRQSPSLASTVSGKRFPKPKILPSQPHSRQTTPAYLRSIAPELNFRSIAHYPQAGVGGASVMPHGEEVDHTQTRATPSHTSVESEKQAHSLSSVALSGIQVVEGSHPSTPGSASTCRSSKIPIMISNTSTSRSTTRGAAPGSGTSQTAMQDSTEPLTRSSTIPPCTPAPSAAKSLTWKLRTGHRESFKTFSILNLTKREDQDWSQDYLQHVFHVTGGMKKNKNIRASMGCCQLRWHGLKAWLARQRRKHFEIPIFNTQIKNIEAQFGSGVVSFFVFTRWLVLLNLLLSVAWLGLVVGPQAGLFSYLEMLNSKFYVKNLLDGENALSNSWLFYGGYEQKLGRYPLSLIYLALILFTYFGSLFITFGSVAQAMRLSMPDPRGGKYPFGVMTFASWDYSIQSPEAATNLSLGICNSFRDQKFETFARQQQEALTRRQKCEVYARRTLAWLITLCLLGVGCGCIMLLATRTGLISLLERFGLPNFMENSFFSVYGVPLGFTLVNITVPFFVHQLPRMEQYVSGKDELNITVGRVFILRITNIIALIISLYYEVQREGGFQGCAGTLLGQELYRLVIVDTIVQFVLQLVPPIIKFYWTKTKSEFAIAKKILVLVYRQALIWTGTIVCPMLPLLGSASVAVMFGVNYMVVRKTCMPPRKRWSQSRHSSFFMAILAGTLVILILFVSLIISRNDIVNLGQVGHSPNVTCGPFPSNTSILSAFTVFREDMTVTSPLAGQLLDFVLSSSVLLPALCIMLAVLYFQHLTIQWQSDSHTLALAALQQEREENKDLLKRLHTS